MFVRRFVSVILLISSFHHTTARQHISCNNNNGLISIVVPKPLQDPGPNKSCAIEFAPQCWFLGSNSSRVPVSNASCAIDRGLICNQSVACRDVDPCSIGCHGYYKCKNEKCVSDPKECVDREAESGVGFRCSVNGTESRIPQERLLDEIEDCDNGEDLCYVAASADSNNQPRDSLNTSRCFSCFDHSMLIPRDRVCDGVIDCSDLSDECLCNWKVPKICNDVIQASSMAYSDNSTPCTVGRVNCGGGVCINRTRVCDGVEDCPDGRDESPTFCSTSFQAFHQAGHFLRNQNTNGNIFLTVVPEPEPKPEAQPEPEPEPFGFSSAIYQKSCIQNVSSAYTCQSVDEKEVFINFYRACDLVCDCSDCRDEWGCLDGRFYCESREPLFVSGEKIYNSRGDCSDWSDECPSTHPPNTAYDPISSGKDLIRFPILRGFIWIMAIIAVTGNGIVIGQETKRLRSLFRSTLHGPLRTNHLLILNLAVADFLMGIYLVMLGIVEFIYREKFCQNQLAWCSGTICQIMGTMVVLSSETSVVTMVLLTTFRLLSVFKPIASIERPKIWTIAFLILLSWLISLSLALAPLLPSLENLFSGTAYVPGIPFFRSDVVSFDEAKAWALKGLTYDPLLDPNTLVQRVYKINNATSWIEIKEGIGSAAISDYLTITGLFGYYSANSVCIPRLFVTRQQKSWRYSFTLTIFNLIAFLYVALAYIAILVKAKNRRIRRESRRMRTKRVERSRSMPGGMQQKIFCLILTDFCCWVPISVIAIIKFAGILVPDLAYVISAVVLLPINSALNPIIYSDLIRKFMRRVSSYKLLSSNNSSTTNLSKIGKPTTLPGSPNMKSKNTDSG